MQEALSKAYRSTFEEYASKLGTLQRLMEADSADPTQIEAAKRDVENARHAYNAARDRLAQELVRVTASEDDVRRTARVLWEMAGRPEGSAERDWRHAEELVRRVSA